MSLDLTKSAQAILVQQINSDNGKTFTVEELSFGPVMTNTDPDAEEFEAVVMVTGVAAQGWNDTWPYKFNRIDLETIFAGTNATYNVDSCLEYADLLALINTKLGTNMQLTVLPDNDTNQLYVAGDITPASLPSPHPAQPAVAFILTADPNSYIYRGQAMLTATTTTQSISGAIAAPSTGLVYTAPVA